MEFISASAKQFKANLHSHSTLSDGKLSPEDLIRIYRQRGYSILAITDHEAPYDHSAASDENFLLITGYEAYIRPSPNCAYDPLGPEIHLNLLAKEPHNTCFIGFDPNFCKYMPPETAAKRVKLGNIGPRRYAPDYIQSFIDLAREGGYLVSYNHPCWSMEDPSSIFAYDGCFSMEIYNSGSMAINGLERNLALYDMMLRRGKFLYCHGADDNHNKLPLDDYLSDSFGAWTMILAKELSYPAVIEALEQGRFYASTGPEIKVLRFEGSHVHMEFSAAVRAMMHISPKYTVNVYQSHGSPIYSADFEIPAFAPYVFFSLLAADGTEACTHAFTRAELGI